MDTDIKNMSHGELSSEEDIHRHEIAISNWWSNVVVFAAEKHKLQFRKSDGSSYICHPLRVANIMLKCDWSEPRLLAAAILHDTVEDTDCTLDEIEQEFGKEVAYFVSQVTDDKSLPKVERKKLQIEHAKQICKSAQVIKLADKIDNLTSMIFVPPKGWSHEVIRGYFIWSHEVVRNIWDVDDKMKKMLEDLFKQEYRGERMVPESRDEQLKLLEEYYDLIDVDTGYSYLVILQYHDQESKYLGSFDCKLEAIKSIENFLETSNYDNHHLSERDNEMIWEEYGNFQDPIVVLKRIPRNKSL
jgi:guanosine-3',5'-bis(diphosphate) 3'-pyrophosphohydrolase